MKFANADWAFYPDQSKFPNVFIYKKNQKWFLFNNGKISIGSFETIVHESVRIRNEM